MFLKMLTGAAAKVKGLPLQAIGIFLACLVSAYVFLEALGPHYAASHWLSWHVGIWFFWTALLNLSLVCFGHQILCLVLPVLKLRTPELLLQSFCIGLAGFASAMYAAGFLALYNSTFALLLPFGFIALSYFGNQLLFRRLNHRFRQRRYRSKPISIIGYACLAVTVVGTTIVYLSALSFESFNFDSIWYHIPIAQDYVRLGEIGPLYGDNHRAFPHLASFLHTWALLVPGVEPVQSRWLLMLHLEFSCVIWRIIGVIAVAQWILKGRKPFGLSAAFFLFPSIFIYDQNIGGGGDQLLAVTAAPIFLAHVRALRSSSRPWAMICGLLAGVHILTKYQSIYVVVAVATSTLAWTFFRPSNYPLRFKGLRKNLVVGVMIFGAALLVSSPHFFKNWHYYQNPVYPLMSSTFPSSFSKWDTDPNDHIASQQKKANGDAPSKNQPARRISSKIVAAVTPVTVPDVTALPSFSSRHRSFEPQGTGWYERALWSQAVFWSWSFDTGNRHLTKYRPYMGSLFTLLLPLILFLTDKRRLLFALCFSYLCFMVWAISNANDRYLLGFLGIPIAVTAAIILKSWTRGVLARLGIVVIVGIQILWIVDVPLRYGVHAIKGATQLVNTGYDKKRESTRFNYRANIIALSRKFPDDAVILGRYYKSLLGFNHATYNTHSTIQKSIPFAKLTNTRDLWRVCKARGITHVLYPVGRRKPIHLRDIILVDALLEQSERISQASGIRFATLSELPPREQRELLVLVIGQANYRDGVFRVNQLSANDTSRSKKKRLGIRDYKKGNRIPGNIDAVYANRNSLSSSVKKELSLNFRLIERFKGSALYFRASRFPKLAASRN